MRLVLITALSLGAAAPATAAWQRASTPHFVIYADESPAELKAFAQKLERFDKAVRVSRAMADPPVGDGNRLRVFVVPGQTEVTRLMRGVDRGVAGFYRMYQGGSVAVVPRDLPRSRLMTADNIFFHEYAHHLMFQELATPYPPWFVEGFAEFMSTAKVKADGSVGLGEPLQSRPGILSRRTNPLPFAAMLGAEPLRNSEERASLYAHGWLLAHYLTFAPQRRGQLETYLAGIAAGRTPLQSARQAFGALDSLERETQAYYTRGNYSVLTILASQLPIGAVNVEPLGPGMTAIIPLLMRLRSGVDRDDKAGLANKIRTAAAPFGSDPAVQAVLAEAELDAGNVAAADAAADRAIAANPTTVDALLIKGRATLQLAGARAPGASFAEARNWFMRANKVDPEDPEPLLMFYRTYGEEKARPTANAIGALHYAADLAPQDMALRLINARQYLADGKPAEARRALIPLAYNPHGGQLSDEARRTIALIDAGRVKAAAAAPGAS